MTELKEKQWFEPHNASGLGGFSTDDPDYQCLGSISSYVGQDTIAKETFNLNEVFIVK